VYWKEWYCINHAHLIRLKQCGQLISIFVFSTREFILEVPWEIVEPTAKY
jgi:hypothetical protein